MPIKESSDELNPAVAIPASKIAPRLKRSASDYLALAIATCGVGYFPIAPGTLGSLVGVALYVTLRTLTVNQMDRLSRVGTLSWQHPEIAFLGVELVTIALVTSIGIWAAARAERIFQKKDPGKVVIDEVAGQLIALLPIPLAFPPAALFWIIIAFLLFRAFDIVKPYPIRRLEALESGLGIVVDDLAAGLYAAILISIPIALASFFQYLPDVF